MNSTRRGLLGALAGWAAVLVAGCTTAVPFGDDATPDGSSGEDATTDQPTGTGGGRAFEAHLSGPEGDRPLFDGADLHSVGAVDAARGGGYVLPVALTDDGAAGVSETFRSAGVVQAHEAFEVVLSLEGEELERFGIAPSFADAVRTGDWAGEMRLTFDSREEATEVRRTVCDTGGVGPDCMPP
jgi:hypothetical protein